jgi:biotin synthase
MELVPRRRSPSLPPLISYNGANPRPDDRSGRFPGEAPRTSVDELIDRQAEANLWNPDVQLKRRKKASVSPRPDGADDRPPEIVHVDGEGR